MKLKITILNKNLITLALILKLNYINYLNIFLKNLKKTYIGT